MKPDFLTVYTSDPKCKAGIHQAIWMKKNKKMFQ